MHRLRRRHQWDHYSHLGAGTPVPIGGHNPVRRDVYRSVPLAPPLMLLSVLHLLPDVGQVDAFAEPWRRLYSHSTLVSTLVLFGHIGGLLAGGGLALASDRAT